MNTYFETMSAAIETAKQYAISKGFEVVENSTLYPAVNYLTTERIVHELKKNDKVQKKALVIVLYRMDSGRYELTTYIN